MSCGAKLFSNVEHDIVESNMMETSRRHWIPLCEIERPGGFAKNLNVVEDSVSKRHFIALADIERPSGDIDPFLPSYTPFLSVKYPSPFFKSGIWNNEYYNSLSYSSESADNCSPSTQFLNNCSNRDNKVSVLSSSSTISDDFDYDLQQRTLSDKAVDDVFQEDSDCNCCDQDTTYQCQTPPPKASAPSLRINVDESEWPGFIDSHCHIDLILKRNKFNGSFQEFKKEHSFEFPSNYKGCVAVFCYPDTFKKKYLWAKHLTGGNVWASFGCHPKRAQFYNNVVEKELCAALEHPKVRALGEIGLDYSSGSHCHPDVQKSVFKRQLDIAVKRKLPIVVHCRDAYKDCLEILKLNVPTNHKIHLHCFKDKWTWANEYLEAFPNLCIGLTNFVTFPNARMVHEVAAKIPLDRLLLETDAPYFVPKALSEDLSLSHPGHAIHVASKVASIKKIPLRTVLEATFNNTKKLYNL